MDWVEQLNNNIYIKEVFINRLNSLQEIYNNNEINYPITVRIFGYKLLKVNNKEEMIGRINELKDILGVD
jgi:hypothetical protein